MTPPIAHPILPPQGADQPGQPALPLDVQRLLVRALWVIGQMPRLHELSEQIGIASHVCDIESTDTVVQAQTIMEAANRVQAELSELLAVTVPPEPTLPALRLKEYRKRL